MNGAHYNKEERVYKTKKLATAVSRFLDRSMRRLISGGIRKKLLPKYPCFDTPRCQLTFVTIIDNRQIVANMSVIDSILL